jgi:hypothetical protein
MRDLEPPLVPALWTTHAPSAERPTSAQESQLMCYKRFFSQLTTIVVLAWCLSCGPSAAEVRLSGTPDHVVLQANDATMPDILAALRSAFDLEVKLKGTTARRFTGVYSGSVRQVLSRLLRSEDYVLRSAADGMSMVLFGTSASDSTARWSGLPPAAPGSRLVALRQGLVKRRSDSE